MRKIKAKAAAKIERQIKKLKRNLRAKEVPAKCIRGAGQSAIWKT